MKFIVDYFKWLFSKSEEVKPSAKEKLSLVHKKLIIKNYTNKRKTYGNKSTGSKEVRSTGSSNNSE